MRTLIATIVATLCLTSCDEGKAPKRELSPMIGTSVELPYPSYPCAEDDIKVWANPLVCIHHENF